MKYVAYHMLDAVFDECEAGYITSASIERHTSSTTCGKGKERKAGGTWVVLGRVQHKQGHHGVGNCIEVFQRHVRVAVGHTHAHTQRARWVMDIAAEAVQVPSRTGWSLQTGGLQ